MNGERHLPPDAPSRAELHAEVHARPPARIRLPARVTLLAVLNDGVPREAEAAHLRALPGAPAIADDAIAAGFVRLKLPWGSLRWERHGEFSRYTAVHAPDANPLPPAWLATTPGTTLAAVRLTLLPHTLADPAAALTYARTQFAPAAPLVASLLGRGHSLAVTAFDLDDHGFEAMLVLAPEDTSATRAGRVVQRLLELEVYRLMALRGLPVAKALLPELAANEAALADVTAQLEARAASEAALLDELIHVAASVERATAAHQYRFGATAAYHGIVQQRVAELREVAIAGTQTLGEFMQRRLAPAMATVAATERRLAALATRIERVSALLRTRVDIATEAQSQQLLAKLQRGQALQLKLQTTVEGLSIAAISYYVVSLLLYVAKAAKNAGLPINPELAAGLAIPVVIAAVWWGTRRIHAGLHQAGE